MDLTCRVLLPAGYCSHFLIPLTSTHLCCIVTVECKRQLLIWTLFNCYYLAALVLNTSWKRPWCLASFFCFFSRLESFWIENVDKRVFNAVWSSNFVCVQFHTASLSNFSHKQGIAVATKAGGGKHNIQINGIRLANRTSFYMCTKPRDICSLCGPEARVYTVYICWKESLAFNVAFPFVKNWVNMESKLTIKECEVMKLKWAIDQNWKCIYSPSCS